MEDLISRAKFVSKLKGLEGLVCVCVCVCVCL